MGSCLLRLFRLFRSLQHTKRGKRPPEQSTQAQAKLTPPRSPATLRDGALCIPVPLAKKAFDVLGDVPCRRAVEHRRGGHHRLRPAQASLHPAALGETLLQPADEFLRRDGVESGVK